MTIVCKIGSTSQSAFGCTSEIAPVDGNLVGLGFCRVAVHIDTSANPINFKSRSYETSAMSSNTVCCATGCAAAVRLVPRCQDGAITTWLVTHRRRVSVKRDVERHGSLS